MLSHTLRRVSPRSFRSIFTIGENNDYIAAIANIYRPRSFSSSICETTDTNNGETTTKSASEIISFPITANPSGEMKTARDLHSLDNEMEDKPILLNAKEHAVGYLNRILNARVYDAAIETELQHAINLSSVSGG